MAKRLWGEQDNQMDGAMSNFGNNYKYGSKCGNERRSVPEFEGGGSLPTFGIRESCTSIEGEWSM